MIAIREAYAQLTSTRWRRIALAVAVAIVTWLVANAVLPDGAPLGIVLQGVVFGTITGLLAVGLVLIYRTNRIINFAYAAMGGVGGVLTVQLFNEAGLPYVAAVAIGVVVGLAIGGLVEVLAVRRFENSSRLVLTVATIGLAQVLAGIQLYTPRFFDSTGFEGAGGFVTPLSDIGFNVGVVRFNGNHLLILAAIPPILAALAWFLLRTDAGVAVRAAAENRDRALLLGIPIRRLTTLVWIVAGGLASLTFILKAPFAGGLATIGGPASLLPALAAAVIARMVSLPTAFLGGIGLGILEQVTFWNTQKASSIDVAFLAVILAALLLQRRRLSRAEEAGEATWSLAEVVRGIPTELRALPEVRGVKYAGLVLLLALAIVLPRTWEVSTVSLAATAMIFGIVVVSLVVLTGWGGNISLGQFAIVGVGAVAAGNILVRYNIDLFVTLAVAGLAGGLVALVVGLPALRIRGLFLAATTLAFAVAFDSFFLNPNNFPGIVQTSVTRPTLWQGRYDLDEGLVFYYLTLAFLVLSILVAVSVRRARSGRVILATRDNVRAAAAAGVPTTGVRLTGFVLSGVLAGIAGGLFVVQIRGAGAGSFNPNLSIEVFSAAVIGGMASIGGALSGVFLLRWLEQVLSGEARLLVTGAGLLFILMILPGGIAQVIFRVRDRLLRRVAERRGLLVPSLVEDRRAEIAEEEAPTEVGVPAGAQGDDAEPVLVAEEPVPVGEETIAEEPVVVGDGEPSGSPGGRRGRGWRRGGGRSRKAGVP